MLYSVIKPKMKICPHCGSNLKNHERICPSCGTAYWEPGLDSPQEETRPPDSEIAEGCFSVLLIPFLIGAGITTILILSGFLLNLLVHFENNQIKIAWIGLSILTGIGIYKGMRVLKARKQKKINPK